MGVVVTRAALVACSLQQRYRAPILLQQLSLDAENILWLHLLTDGSRGEVDVTVHQLVHGDVGVEDGGHASHVVHVLNVEHGVDEAHAALVSFLPRLRSGRAPCPWSRC